MGQREVGARLTKPDWVDYPYWEPFIPGDPVLCAPCRVPGLSHLAGRGGALSPKSLAKGGLGRTEGDIDPPGGLDYVSALFFGIGLFVRPPQRWSTN